MANNRSTDNFNNKDTNNISDTAASKIQAQLHSWKRVKRVKNTKYNNVETYFLNVSNYAIIATTSSDIQESKKILINRFLIPKIINLKVIYCFTLL